MRPYSTVSPITQRLVQVLAIVEKITGVNGPLDTSNILPSGEATFHGRGKSPSLQENSLLVPKTRNIDESLY